MNSPPPLPPTNHSHKLQLLFDFAGDDGSSVLSGAAGKDLYIDGVKLVYGQDYQDSGSNLDYLQAIPAGRRGTVSRHGNINLKIDGTIDKYDCITSLYIISEQVWVDGLRKLKNKEYSLTGRCDLANSDSVVPEKTTIIYDNSESYFNI